ncbi:rhomboid-like protein [Mycobacterium sp. BMJ-28]
MPLKWVLGLRVTIGYAAALVIVAAVLAQLGPAAHDRVFRHASTNLHNLAHGRIGTLLGSAFVVDVGAMALWLPGLICLLAVAELLWRSRKLVLAFLVAHIGATLVIAAALTVAVHQDWVPRSISRATDVGMSYGAMGVLGVLTAAIPARWRPAWVCWWTILGAAVVIGTHDFTDGGHLVALLLGMLVSTRLGAPAPWTGPRVALLAVGSVFGYLVVASSAPAETADVATLIAAGAALAAGGPPAVAMIAGWRSRLNGKASPMTCRKKP